ncbi:unnamed protein product [Prorocentrum cordatum]|uniref:ER membrane protein complex subunit 2 n=1 Tax=Prorocentrum cordatum TaxID=2364126 RepID=A0ABN9WF60_9DINO|nr:unnamed protein product [Polarella glacialis]
MAEDVETFNAGLGAALEVRTPTCDPGGLLWAEELWRWALARTFEMDGLKYGTCARLLDMHQRHDEVDKMIARAAAAGETWLNHAFLGALVNTAAERGDWARADDVWPRLVTDFEVEPTVIEYTALSKAHMMCGRAEEALQVFVEVDQPDSYAVVARVQLLKLVFVLLRHRRGMHAVFSKLSRMANRSSRVTAPDR